MCVRAACCLCSISAYSSPQSPRASSSLGGLAHTQERACALLCACARRGLATTRKSRLHCRPGPQPPHPPRPPSLSQPPPSASAHHLQILNHSTVLASITHTHTHTLFFLFFFSKCALCFCLERNRKRVERQFILEASSFRSCLLFFFVLFFFSKVHLSLSSVCVKSRLFSEGCLFQSFCNLEPVHRWRCTSIY